MTECLVYRGADSDLAQHYSVCPGGGALCFLPAQVSVNWSICRSSCVPPPEFAARGFVKDL